MILWWFAKPTHALPVWIHCCKRQNYDFCISPGSAATYFRCGEMFTYHCVGNFLLCLTVKEFLQSVKIWQSYGKR